MGRYEQLEIYVISNSNQVGNIFSNIVQRRGISKDISLCFLYLMANGFKCILLYTKTTPDQWEGDSPTADGRIANISRKVKDYSNESNKKVYILPLIWAIIWRK